MFVVDDWMCGDCVNDSWYVSPILYPLPSPLLPPFLPVQYRRERAEPWFYKGSNLFKAEPWAFSLFDPIPFERSCSDAGISKSACPCAQP